MLFNKKAVQKILDRAAKLFDTAGFEDLADKVDYYNMRLLASESKEEVDILVRALKRVEKEAQRRFQRGGPGMQNGPGGQRNQPIFPDKSREECPLFKEKMKNLDKEDKPEDKKEEKSEEKEDLKDKKEEKFKDKKEDKAEKAKFMAKVLAKIKAKKELEAKKQKLLLCNWYYYGQQIIVAV